MSAGTAIQWATDTWNFLAGCEKVSRGCKNCYAARLSATRLRHTEKYQGLAVIGGGVPRWSREVRVDEKLLDLPLRWSPGREEPRRVFVNSMSDLFHDDVPDEIILKAFAVMNATPYHRYLILTKRPRRMRDFMRRLAFRSVQGFKPYEDQVAFASNVRRRTGPRAITEAAVLQATPTPPNNVALGVSVEGPKEFEERIDYLKETPAALRFLSIEPLVEDLGDIRRAFGGLHPVDWAIVGGESGPRAHVATFDIAWAVDIRRQAAEAGAAFFYKQPGSVVTYGGEKAEDPANWTREAIDEGRCLADLPAEFPDWFRYGSDEFDNYVRRTPWYR